MKRSVIPLVIALGAPAFAEEKLPSAKELLTAMDQNLQYESQTAELKMTVHDGDRTREYRMIAFARGRTESAVEYLEPVREKGTRMLKKADELWLYMPRAERVQKISGHMMRQGMMGSDVSYEDILASADFEKQYEATVKGSKELDGRRHWELEALARDKSVSYPRRVIWIDAETLIPTRQELYALSGMLLKTWTMSEVKTIGKRRVPMRTEIADQLRKGSRTVIVTEKLEVGLAHDDASFSRRWLERGR